MLPTQVDLVQRFDDIIINDITHGRNKYNFPLNIWVVVDEYGKSRNIAYVLHAYEDTESHTWVSTHLFAVLPPHINRVYVSDSDTRLESAIAQLGGIWHLLCLHHLGGNLSKNLTTLLGARFQLFSLDFWQTYHQMCPAAFDESWKNLLEKYPLTRRYLTKELWPKHERWAWCYVTTEFTCGIRTSGRLEVENRINKEFGNTKTPVSTLIDRLITQANEQENNNTLQDHRVRCFLSSNTASIDVD